jgi:hypothetical protein
MVGTKGWLLGFCLIVASTMITQTASAQDHSGRWYQNQARSEVRQCLRDARERGTRISANVSTISACFNGGFITQVDFHKDYVCRHAPCPARPTQLIAVVQFGCNDPIIYAECTGNLCEFDTDCDASSWCRGTEYGTRECTDYVGAGDTCEGYTLPWYFDRCEPGLQCVTDPQIPDLPGVCATCNDNGTPHMAGDTFTASDGCNTCTCQENGLMACTRMACVSECVTGGCSSHLCVSWDQGGIITTCEYLPEYACLQYTTCGTNGPGGACEWADTRAYQDCLDNLNVR